MKNLQLGSKEFYEACRELTIRTYKDKVPQDVLDKIIALGPEPHESAPEQKALLGAPNAGAKVNVTAAFVYGTIECEISAQKKIFNGTHWGIGLAGFAASGNIYTAYDNWQAFFDNAKAYHVQSAGVAGGVVQVNWFNKNGVPVGQFNGIAGGAGAMEVGGSGSWKDK